MDFWWFDCIFLVNGVSLCVSYSGSFLVIVCICFDNGCDVGWVVLRGSFSSTECCISKRSF
jgi:hypothetical protein